MAKAVRIRIRSGNEEHTSMDSFCENFDLKDIIPLMDGRLERWLRQKQENALADEVSKLSSDVISEDESCLFNFILLFFQNTPHNILNLNMLAKEWVESPKYKKNGLYLYKYLLKKGDSDAAMFLYDNDVLPDNCRLVDLLSEKQGEKDSTGNIEYILGISYFNGFGVNVDIEHGNTLINRAFDKNHPKAKQFVKDRIYDKALLAQGEDSYSKLDISEYWEDKDVVNNNNIRLYIRKFESWDIGDYNKIIMNDSNVKELEFAKFLKILTYIINCDAIEDEEIIKNWLCNFFHGILYRESQFVYAILLYSIDKSSAQYKTILNDIRLDYCPAIYLLNSEVNLIKVFSTEWKKLKIVDFDKMDPIEQIKYIIHHLFEF